MPRTVARLVTAHQQREGGGFLVRRPFPTQGLDHLDPFLMLDELGPVTYAPGEALGAPDHPHRGFETVSIVLDGDLEHADSSGHAGSLGPGDVQWMTAGAGVVHREMPSRRMQQDGGRVHAFQLWVNLPRAHKRTAPRYQELRAASIPAVATPDGRGSVRLLAGEALGARGPVATHSPVTVLHVRLDAGGVLDVPTDPEHTVGVYLFEGSATLAGTPVTRGQLAVTGPGDSLALHATESTQALILAGRPLREPIAWGGPFVMNTREEVLEAYADFRAGRMGAIPPEIVRA